MSKLCIAVALALLVPCLAKAQGRIIGTPFPEVSVFDADDQKLSSVKAADLINRPIMGMSKDGTRVQVATPAGVGFVRLRDIRTDGHVAAPPSDHCVNMSPLAGSPTYSSNGLSGTCRKP